MPEQRFTDLAVSKLCSKPPARLFNEPPVASLTTPVIDSWFPLLVHVWIPDDKRPYLEKPCRFNGFSQDLRQAIAFWVLEKPIRDAFVAHHPDLFFDLIGALWYARYDRALIEAYRTIEAYRAVIETHPVNLEFLCPYLDIKPHDIR